jgi:putative mRNA 3-end processing factor
MLGSAQVLVEDVKGTRIVNTGDFMMPNTPTLQPDILVMEATYGDPSHVRFYDRQLITEKFISLVKERVKQEPVYIFSRQGRLQHLMNLLIEADVDVPFLAPEKIFIVAQVYERYGLKVGDCLQLKGEEANEVLKSGQPYIAFHSIGSEKRIKELEKFLSIHVSQYATDESFAETRKNHYSVAISDHADFNGLYEYVRESNPKRLIIDSYRCGQAIIFGEEIRKRLNIKVETQPYCLGV